MPLRIFKSKPSQPRLRNLLGAAVRCAVHDERLRPLSGDRPVFPRWSWRCLSTSAFPSSSSSSVSTPSAYHSAYRQSIDDPAAFWGEAARAVEWTSTAGPILHYASASPESYSWFPERRLNTAYNCLDLHCQQGRGQQVAVIHDSPVTGSITRLTYAELLDASSRLAGALQSAGVRTGDVVLLYMPMIPQALVAMLACARIGAIHTVVFGGFAAAELAKRIADCRPSVVITASCGIEPRRTVPYKPLVDEGIALSGHAVETVVVYQRPQLRAGLRTGRDVDFDEFMRSGRTTDPVPLPSTHPLYILYTSGTTGAPKGVVRDNGGHAVALKWALRYLFDQRPGEVFWAASDIGWVVGHSFIVYAPLLLGCTTVLYEGKPVGTPDAGAFWRVIAEHGVNTLFTAPTAFRAIKKEDSRAALLRRYDLPAAGFRALYLAGERADADTVEWAQSTLRTVTIDNYWQTESGWPIICNPAGLHRFPVKKGSAALPVCGFNTQLLDDAGQLITAPNTEGNLALRLPLPPGCLTTLHNSGERYRSSYLSRFPSYYDTSDTAYRDEDGYVFVMGRSDDVLNVAAHRLSSAQLEEAVAGVGAVAECAVVGKKDALKGEVPVAFVVVKTGDGQTEDAVRRACVDRVRDSVGPVASMRSVYVVQRLPKTRSGKILRKVLRALVDGIEPQITPTIEDVNVIEEVRQAIRATDLREKSDPA